MDILLISRAPCAKKVRYTDPYRRVYSRTFTCMCVFVILVLIMLNHCSHLDSTSPHAQVSPSTSHVNPHAHKGFNSRFSMFTVGTPPFAHKAPSVSLLLGAESAAPVRSRYSQKPSAALLHSVRPPSFRGMLHAQKSSPSGANKDVKGASSISASRTALQGLGTLFIMGTIAVSELVVAHVEEGTSIAEFRLFLRTFHRSGMSARSDVVFLFPSNALLAVMEHVILEEHTHLCKLLTQNNQNSAYFNPASNTAIHSDENVYSNSTISPFQYNAFGSTSVHNLPIWGRDPVDFIGSSKQKELGDGSLEFGFGSIVGFDASEVNPDNSLQGFIDNPPLELRRWPSYQMLLGMAKHEFKQVLLTAVSGVLILGDPLAMARRKAGLYFSLTDIHWGSTSTLIENDNEGKFESHVRYADTMQGVQGGASADIEGNVRAKRTMLMLPHAPLGVHSNIKYKEPSKQFKQYSMGAMQKHRKRYMQRRVNQHRKAQKETGKGVGLYERVYGSVMWNMLDNEGKKKSLVNSAAIVGDMRHVRGIANAMVTEIVKVALQRESRQTFPDSVLLSHIVHNRNEIVLGKKVIENLHLLDNSASFVHALMGSHQPSPFHRQRSQQAFPMISGGQGSSRIWNHVVDLIHKDICSSSADAKIYNDCLQ